MAFVLQHRESGQLYTCLLINTYQLPYYGTKFWPVQEEAEQEKQEFLAGQEAANAADWAVIELEEAKLKTANVKLRNDPSIRIYWNTLQQTFHVEREDGSSC
ncbi:hypothetical protein [Paenibacillus sp. y28]|uniref:hypothetical protein n=1 Tax=Paenibacillus sp. y28 TaxID=3129110 RepID=UPI0030188404